jgi:hypothetical protein
MSRLWQFSVAAIEGQPLAYLHAVWLDALRLLDSSRRSYGDLSADQLIAYLLYGPDFHSGRNAFVSYWETLEYPHDSQHHGNTATLQQWERITRLDGPLMAVLLLLCAVGAWTVPRPARSDVRLLVLIASTLLAFPIIVKGYDYRFVIPALGPLTAAAALSAWSLASRAQQRRRKSSAKRFSSPERQVV